MRMLSEKKTSKSFGIGGLWTTEDPEKCFEPTTDSDWTTLKARGIRKDSHGGSSSQVQNIESKQWDNSIINGNSTIIINGKRLQLQHPIKEQFSVGFWTKIGTTVNLQKPILQYKSYVKKQKLGRSMSGTCSGKLLSLQRSQIIDINILCHKITYLGSGEGAVDGSGEGSK